MGKRFDLDIGKQRARARFREFLAKRIFDRKKQKVLCFPGERGLEIEQVYRKLGIIDENIYGVERDAQAAKRIRTNYPKINLFEGDINDFCSQYDGEPFSIISLDYCGIFSQDKTKPLALLQCQSKIASHAVVGMNIMAGRETQDDQTFLRETYFRSLLDRRDIKGKSISDPDVMDEFNSVIQKSKTDALSDARNDAMTQSIIALVSYTMPAAYVCAKAKLTKARGSGVVISIDSKFDFDENGKVRVNNVELVKTDDTDSSMFTMPVAVKHEAIQDINEELRDYGIIPENGPEFLRYHLGRTLVMQTFDKHGFAHLPVGMQRYSYISDSGRRMISDFIELKTFEDDLWRIPVSIAPVHKKDGSGEHRFFLWPRPEKFKSPTEHLNFLMSKVVKPYALLSEKIKSLPEQWPDRIDLGGGEAMSIDEDKIQEHVIALIKKGRTTEEIARKYPMLGVGKIRAIRAHVTMGTY